MALPGTTGFAPVGSTGSADTVGRMRTRRRVGIAAAVLIAGIAGVFIARGAADALAPSSGEVHVTFGSCGFASTTFDGDAWNEGTPLARPEVANRRLPAHLEIDGNRGLLTWTYANGQPGQASVERGGFVRTIGCI